MFPWGCIEILLLQLYSSCSFRIPTSFVVCSSLAGQRTQDKIRIMFSELQVEVPPSQLLPEITYTLNSLFTFLLVKDEESTLVSLCTLRISSLNFVCSRWGGYRQEYLRSGSCWAVCVSKREKENKYFLPWVRVALFWKDYLTTKKKKC